MLLSIVRADAHVAQSVEHFLGKEEVTGSNPVVGLQKFGDHAIGHGIGSAVELVSLGR